MAIKSYYNLRPYSQVKSDFLQSTLGSLLFPSPNPHSGFLHMCEMGKGLRNSMLLRGYISLLDVHFVYILRICGGEEAIMFQFFKKLCGLSLSLGWV